MMLESFPDLITAYLEEHLRGKASYQNTVGAAAPWIRTLTTTPTRAEILARQRALGAGHFQPNATKGNKEIALIRAACRWGLYQERWLGGDPTLGIKKWQSPKRRRTGKFDELRKLLGYFDRAASKEEIRDRALYGLMLFSGCRPSEARMAKLDAITAYGAMGCWNKGKTKNGETQELPLPTHYMPWLAAWKAIRPTLRPSPYLFPDEAYGEPLTSDFVRRRWHELRLILSIHGLWTYDLRRTLASYLSNELKVDDSTIRAILNHNDTSALSHYRHKTFDSLTDPIQYYADWLWSLKEAAKSEILDPAPIPNQQALPIPAYALPSRWPKTPPAVTGPTSPAPIPIVHNSHSVEREEWTG